MNILVLNQDWFAAEWREAGHRVITCGIATHLDVVVTMPVLHIDTLLDMVPGGFSPDVVVVMDNSSPLLFTGLEETTVPTIFYSVDTHHHAELHGYLFRMFDAFLVAQKD